MKEIQIDPGFVSSMAKYWSKDRAHGNFYPAVDGWRKGRYNESIEDYGVTFFPVLPVMGDGHKLSLAKFIANAGNGVIVDIMAPSGTLANLLEHEEFRRGIPRRAISQSVVDDRTEVIKDRDKQLRVTHIVGNITHTQGLRKLEEELRGEKAKVILERGWGGLDTLPPHPQFYRYIVQRLWSNVLSEQYGQMLLETPNQQRLGINLSTWRRVLNQHGIEAYTGVAGTESDHGVIRLIKKPDSPLLLPV